MAVRIGTRFASPSSDLDIQPTPSPAAFALPLAALGVVALFAAWTRFVGLDISLWWDEISTVYHYVSNGPEAIFDPDQYIPNNHVLFSFLTWSTSSLFGMTERAIRLWSVIPGLGGVAVLAWWAWHRLGPWPAVAVAALPVLSPLHVELVPQARGYGLAFLAAAMMLAGAVRTSETGRLADVALWAGGGLMGLLTLPTLVFPFVLHGALMLARPGLRSRLVVAAAGASVGIASLAFYWTLLPAIAAESTAVGSRQGAAPGVIGGITWPFRLLIAPSMHDGLPFLPGWLASTVGLGLLLAGVIALARVRADRPLLLHLVVPVVGTLWAMGLVGMHVRGRYISFLLFHCLVLVAIGFVWVVRQAWRVRGAAGPTAVAVGVLAVVAASATLSLHLSLSSLPRENFKDVAMVVGDDLPERVITNRAHPIGFQYYLGLNRDELEIVDPAEAPALVCDAEGPFVFFDYPFNAESGDLSCLADRGAVRIAVPQRVDPFAIDVWILETRSGT